MTVAKQAQPLRRTEIREILGRTKGAKIEIARDLGVSPQAVSSWLAGHSKSKRIADAAQSKAVELLASESVHA